MRREWAGQRVRFPHAPMQYPHYPMNGAEMGDIKTLDTLDTRDLIEERDALFASARDGEPLDDADAARLYALHKLLHELEDYGAADGIALIPESAFEDYARELAEDIGAVSADAAWPAYCIDWKRAARDLAVDYSSITFDGVDYYWREA